jgi:threonine aldolase
VNFGSDNISGAALEVLAAISAANAGSALPYGDDPWTKRLQVKLTVLFDHPDPVTVLPVITGTAANALVLATMTPPWGAIYCHADAHVYLDECGAPEFFSGGAKLVPLPGSHGKLTPDVVAYALARSGAGDVHSTQPAVLSITQPTEAGTIYSPGEIRALTDLAHSHGLRVHMDGARLANAVARLGCRPGDITWRAGVDGMSFGGTKNGAVSAEAAIFFDSSDAPAARHLCKRAGHLFSKMRYSSAQLEALITDGLWIRHAAHANRLASQLAEGLMRVPGVRVVHPVEVNEVFVEIPRSVIEALLTAGFYFNPPDPNGVVRLVTSFDTREPDVASFVAVALRHAALVPVS